jgi:hypothetical protein
VDYILGADTHERVREPLHGKFCKVTESGAFASFVGKLDLVFENGAIKEETYALLDVDPERYAEDEQMKTLVAAAREPYRDARAIRIPRSVALPAWPIPGVTTSPCTRSSLNTSLNTPLSRQPSKAAPSRPMRPQTCSLRWRERAIGSGERRELSN